MNASMRIRPALLILAALLAGSAAAQAPVGGQADLAPFDQHMQVDPSDPAALNNLAVIQAGQGRYADARALLERAARLAPQSVEIRDNLARVETWMEAMKVRNPQAGAEPGAAWVPPEPPPLWNRAAPP